MMNKEIITTLNEKLVFLMDETWKRSCQLLPSSKGFPRDKSQDMECMMNKFTYSTFRMAGGKKDRREGSFTQPVFFHHL